MVDSDQPSPYCAACRHNQTVPDLSVPENVARWRKIEFAKHRLMYSLLKLQLPLATRAEDPADGLAFEFLVPGAARPDGSVTPVMTGHANGVITINLTEADDAERERTRGEMGEAYRTLLGHFRHEIGHYYWDRLIAELGASGKIPRDFRRRAARLRRGVEAALRQWFARQLAEQFRLGLRLKPSLGGLRRNLGALFPYRRYAGVGARLRHQSCVPRVPAGAELATTINFDPHNAKIGPIVDAWTGLSIAVNRDQPQHGAAGPLPVRSHAGHRQQADLHSRLHPCSASAGHAQAGRGLVAERSKPPRHSDTRGLSRADFC